MSNKKSDIKEMLKLGLILVCYAVAACTVLAVVNSFTSVKIAQNQKDTANKGLKLIFPEANDFIQFTDFESSKNSSISLNDAYLAKKGDETLGAVIQVSGPTYDKGKLMVGVDKNGIIKGMKILELSDSPGFGLKANDPTFKLPNGLTFYDQFTGKDAKNGMEANVNFDAISGATITSKAIGDLVTEGTSSLIKYLEENVNE